MIAQLYPVITQAKKIKLSAKDRLVLDAQVQRMDTRATCTKPGNFFKIVALVSVNTQQAKRLSYGLEGKVTLITHKTTYLNYLLDKVFNM